MISVEAPKVSVIMPVYNAERYVGKTIESILEQTFHDYELLLIDDGSTDTSGAICDEYAARDARIRVFHKENGGICSARNFGLERANGRYLAFCDNDDRYLPNLLKDNYELADQYNADVVRFKRMRFSYVDGRKKTEAYSPFPFNVFRKEEIGKNFHALWLSGVGVWNGLYRRTLVEEHHIRFPIFMKFGGEDQYFNLCVYEYSRCVVMNPEVYYYLIQRETQSTSHKFGVNCIASDLANMKRKWMVQQKLNVAESEECCFFDTVCGHLRYAYRYMARKACPYGWIQKAGILRQVCLRIPDKTLLKAATRDEKMKNAILRNDGFLLMRLLGKEGLEW